MGLPNLVCKVDEVPTLGNGLKINNEFKDGITTTTVNLGGETNSIRGVPNQAGQTYSLCDKNNKCQSVTQDQLLGMMNASQAAPLAQLQNASN